jgi:hypothetical protein
MGPCPRAQATLVHEVISDVHALEEKIGYCLHCCGEIGEDEPTDSSWCRGETRAFNEVGGVERARR